MQAYDREVEHHKTRSMLFRFSAIALAMPIVTGIIVFVYASFLDAEWERKDWKLVVLCIWIGTMLSLVWDAFRLLRSDKRQAQSNQVVFQKRSEERGDAVESESRETVSSIGRWENKKSRQILGELCRTAIFLPLGAVMVVFFYDIFFDMQFENKDWKSIVFIIWIGSMIALFRVARKAKDTDLVLEGTHEKE